MYPYAYTVSLRIFHPFMDPAGISEALPFAPRHACKAGEPRRTPNGAPLDGRYQETCWSATIEEECLSIHQAFEDFLIGFVERLRAHAAFFERIRAEQGRVELFVGMFADKNFGFVLPPSLAAAVGALGLTLSVDIYP